jgi:hypothetical protein
MGADREIRTRLIGEDRMGPAFDSAGRKASKMGGALSKVGGLMAGGLVAGAAAGAAGLLMLGKASIDLASDAQQSMGATETVFGKAADTIIRKSSGAAQKYGLSANVYRENANLIGSLFKNQGVAVDQLAGKTDKMIGTASDLAATFGGTTTEAVESLSSAFKGEFDPLERYGISLKQSTVNSEAMAVANVDTAAAFGKLSAKQQTAAKQQATANLIAKQSADSMGSFGKETGTYAHQVQVLGATFDDVRAQLGSALLPKLTTLMKYLSEKLPQGVKMFRDGWKGLNTGTEIGGLADSLHGLSTQLSGLTTQAGDTKNNGFVRLAKGAVNAMTTMSDGFQLAGANWHIITGQISSWNQTVGINFAKMVQHINEAGARMPGPMGRHFKKMADQGRAEIARMQAGINKTNTTIAQNRVTALEIRLRHLGRQKPTPKVRADIAQATAQVQRIQARLRGIKDEYVNVWVSEQRRDDATGRRASGKALAAGGPLNSGQMSWVGEQGPELVKSTGLVRVIPAARSAALARNNARSGGGSGGGDTYIFNINGAIGNHSQLAEALVQAFERRAAGGRKIPRSAISRTA